MRPFRLAVLLTAFQVSAFAWGCEGHQIVALIARAHLTPAASAAVDRLLRENPIDPALDRFCKDRPADAMADSSTWADDTKRTEKTGVWHYIDIPLTASEHADLAAWCPPIGPSVNGKDRPGCIVNALEYERAILRDTAKPAAERATALRYVIHFAGDIHQPLHDSDNDDSGGNCTSIHFFAEDHPANLHAIWDYKLIQHELTNRKLTQDLLASDLDRQFSAQWPTWGEAKPDPVAWAWEGWGLAKSVTYGDLKPPIPFVAPNPQVTCNSERDTVAALKISIGDDYAGQTTPILEKQLAKAGYRLAALLNQTFAP
jgi:hypothetical protein